MKLRLRSLESKETLKIEVPNPCSLQQLKDTIFRSISCSSSTSLHLSLNRKDEIDSSSPQESLHSIGIASGDLVFYTLNPTAFFRETLPHKPTPQEETVPLNKPTIQDSPVVNPSDADSEKSLALDAAEAETAEMVDGSESDGAVVVTSSNCEPSFVKRVLREALGDDVTDFKLLVLVVHGVIVESGFVRVDQVSGKTVTGNRLIHEWPSSAISLRYTLSEILNNGSSHAVDLKIQTLGHLVNVCGSLSDDVGSRVHRVCLGKEKFARSLELMLAKSDSKASFNDGGDDDRENRNQIFELWKMMKDRLALPLLIDLCEKAGLQLPPCFMRLPMELKLMIFNYLPGDDLAKLCCTCSELRYLASSDDELWRKKFEEAFQMRVSGGGSIKDVFARCWVTRKKSKEPRPIRRRQTGMMGFFPRRGPNPFGVPLIWGGEFDLQPQPGFGLNLAAYTTRRTFLPPCHLGEFNY